MRFIASFFILVMMTSSCAQASQDVIFFDIDQMTTQGTSFYLPMDGNEWLESRAIHSGTYGFFAYSYEITTLPGSASFAKEWKCPYCNRFWPWGTPCQNANCPSKFKP